MRKDKQAHDRGDGQHREREPERRPQDVRRRAREDRPSPQVRVRYGGAAEMQDESFASIFTALILAVILIYIVMAAIMESLRPSVHDHAHAAARSRRRRYVALLFGETINIFSLMSMVMLSGIVVNNAILMLDYTAQLRAKGAKIREALLEACSTRLRPIIMANLAIVIGIIPQLIFGGAGVELRAPMAVVQIGGIVVSTFFTLFIIPIGYTIVDKLTRRGGGSVDGRAKAASPRCNVTD